MSPQSYNVANAHAHEISVWKILSRLLHSRDLHLGGINGDFQSDLSTLKLNNVEKLEDFNSIVIRLQQEIIISGETVSPTDFSSSTLRKYQRSINSNHSLRPI